VKVVDLFVIGLGVAIEPFPILAFILILASDRGLKKGLGFLFGWVLSLVVVIALVLLVTHGTPPTKNSAPSIAIVVAKIVLGVGLIVWALRERHQLRIGKKKHGPEPKWMKRVDDIKAWEAIGLGAFLQAWVVVAAGAVVIAGASWSTVGDYIALMGFILLSSSPYLGIELYAVFAPQRADASLARLRDWINSHRIQMEVGVAIVVGLWLVARSAMELAR
jgi:Sap, sulfolipid-1-addressing protein